MSTAVEFDHVSKCFFVQRERDETFWGRVASMLYPRTRAEPFWAVRDLHFQLQPGESLGLIGHNGAGKSTALKLMTRILEPTSGSVQMRGRVAALLELGSGFHPDLSGRENVFLYGSLMGLSRRDMQRRLDAITEFAEIGDFFDMEVKHYSSGMYTRLAFAVATEVDPDILITDEVLAVGDEAFQRRCMERIYRFRRRGKTIIFVSHALEVVRTLCDQAIWLDGGETRASGPSSTVIDAYLEDVNRRERERLDNQRARSAATEDEDDDEEAQPEPDSSNLRRFGSRQVEIVQVELLDEARQPRGVFRTHEPVIVRMHYQAHKPAAFPVFGIALHHANGLWLTGPNTAFAGMELGEIAGSGYVDYVIESLPLLTGTYLLSTAVYDETMLHPFDHHDRLYELVVQSRGVRERHGTISLPAHWEWQPDTQPASQPAEQANVRTEDVM
jgi:lipopolysaccharide transport system ATP-binding protein